jgi:hypothetical protein
VQILHPFVGSVLSTPGRRATHANATPRTAGCSARAPRLAPVGRNRSLLASKRRRAPSVFAGAS